MKVARMTEEESTDPSPFLALLQVQIMFPQRARLGINRQLKSQKYPTFGKRCWGSSHALHRFS